MKLQDLTLQQLKEIVERQPDATDYDFDSKLYWKFLAGEVLQKSSIDCSWRVVLGGLNKDFKPASQLTKLAEIRARIAELERHTVFKVGDRVVFKNGSVNFIFVVEDAEENGDQLIGLRHKGGYLARNPNLFRHATPAEIVAGHRIDSVSAEMASPCPASDSAENQAQMDLQSNEPHNCHEHAKDMGSWGVRCMVCNNQVFYEPVVKPAITTQLDNEAALFNEPTPSCKCHEFPIDAELKAPAGMKHDQSKPRYSLIPAGALALVVDVLEYGATKYAPNNWKRVENARERYYNASMRHIQSWWSGEQNDPETNLPHLAHAACSLMFLMWLDGEQGE